MRALVYHGPGRKSWDEVPDPGITDDGDVIVRVDATTICGTGHTIDGTQAEYVRVPFADTSTFRVPVGAADEEILKLADVLPTGYEVGVLAGGVRPGDVVAVVGAGPVGLSAITSARLFSPSHVVLDEFEAAYDVFAGAADTGALKVVLSR